MPRPLAPWAMALLVLALLPLPAADASHGSAPLPRVTGDPSVDEALAWLATHVDEEGCVRAAAACRPGATKWFALAAGHAGDDPTTWPTPNRSVLGWLLANADDLADSEAARCDDGVGGATEGVAECMARRVYSLAKSILALEAGGVDAREVPLPGGGTRDLVADLLENRTGDQFGSPTYVNDDVWALLALHAVGYDGPEARASADHVADAQNGDGGFAHTTGGTSTVDSTAAAVMALAPRDRPEAIPDALAYLGDAQRPEGDLRACWGMTPDRDANAASTSWALLALAAAREDPGGWAVAGQDPVACLLRFQAPEGGFRNSLQVGQDAPQLPATYQAVTALTWRPYGSLQGPAAGPHVQEADVRAGDRVRVAVPDGVLVHDGARTAEIELRPETPGTIVLHGFTWREGPRPAQIRVTVLPPVPEPPRIHAPGRVPHGSKVVVHLRGDPWSSGLHLRLPNGTVGTGPVHAFDAHAPGTLRLVAWAANDLGEASPTTTRTVEVTNAPPEVRIDGPTTVPRTESVRLEAHVVDPEGDPVELAWTVEGRPAGNGTLLTLPPGPPGVQELTLRATDPWNATSSSSIQLRWVDPPPFLTVDAPSSPDPGNVTLRAEAHDPSGGPVEVTWWLEGTRVAEGLVVDLHLTPGPHVLQVRATTPHGTTERRIHLNVTHPEGSDGVGATPPALDGEPPPDPTEANPKEGRAAAQRTTPLPGMAAVAALAVAWRCRRRNP